MTMAAPPARRHKTFRVNARHSWGATMQSRDVRTARFEIRDAAIPKEGKPRGEEEVLRLHS